MARSNTVWFAAICWATLDLSGPYRKVFDTMLPSHVVKLANFVLDEVRWRVQNETLGHRGRTITNWVNYRTRAILYAGQPN